ISEGNPRVGAAFVAIDGFDECALAGVLWKLPGDAAGDVVARRGHSGQDLAAALKTETDEILIGGGFVGKSVVAAEPEAEFGGQGEIRRTQYAGEIFTVREAGR